MIKLARKRLDVVEEYYFSSKGEVRTSLPLRVNRLLMGIGSPDMNPSKAVIEAIQTAVTQMKMHQYQSYQVYQSYAKRCLNFYIKVITIPL
jgi:aspartate/methionine/tyrosine aminotransferase